MVTQIKYIKIQVMHQLPMHHTHITTAAMTIAYHIIIVSDAYIDRNITGLYKVGLEKIRLIKFIYVD